MSGKAAFLSGFYALYFGAVGVILPFLPAYLKSLSLSGTQVGSLLALPPLLSMIAPQFWGHLADRWGKPHRVLQAVCFGSLISFSPLLVLDQFKLLLATVAVYACFSSAIVPLADTLTLEHIAEQGGSYSRIRLFGSFAFVVTSTSFGVLAPRTDQMTVIIPLCLMGAYSFWSFTARAQSSASSPPNPLSGLRLLRQREIALFLAATCLHWIACAPFHGMFAIHLRDLHLSTAVVGVSAGLGVLSETYVMYAYPHFAQRVAPRRMLFLSFFFSVLRWLGMSFARTSVPIILLCLLHGMTFGAFYVASVAIISSQVPRSLRASGQALFVSVTFGLGGLLGYLASGYGYDQVGGHGLFLAAAGIDLAASGLILRSSAQGHASPSGRGNS